MKIINILYFRWQFELKTVIENCMLFYNSKLVQGGHTDFIGLEMRDRKLHLIMDMGSGMTEVYNDAITTDGEWHLITIQINPSLLEIIVDGKLNVSSRISSKAGNKYLDLSDVVSDEVVYIFAPYNDEPKILLFHSKGKSSLNYFSENIQCVCRMVLKNFENLLQI